MKRILLLLVLVLGLGGIVSAYENTYAVIIGVADYKNFGPDDGDLTYTASDATRFRDFLMSEKGGKVPASNIILLTDAQASKENIVNKSKALFSKAQKNDRVIFYFSGHGNRGCFFPYDSGDIGNCLLYFNEIKAIFRCAKCNTKLLFADACRSGSMKSGLGTSDIDEEKMEEGRKASENMNIAVMMSSQGDETSLESSQLQQGLFTYYLMEGLGGSANRDGNKFITIQELYYYVYHQVQDHAAKLHQQQTPALFGKFDLRLIVANI